MEEEYLKRIIGVVILGSLLVLSFFIIKPLVLSIIFGILLAFIFSPVQNFINKYIKNKNVSAFLITFIFIATITIPIAFFLPVILKQVFTVYNSVKEMDLFSPLIKIFPSLAESDLVSSEINSVITAMASKTLSSFTGYLSDTLINLPILSLQVLVVFFVMFYVLRDGEYFSDYVRSLLPFSKDVEKRFFEQTNAITKSILYGQVIIGILQGIVAGIGYFAFGVPNALLLTLVTIGTAILPMIGPFIIWVPVFIYLLAAGNFVPAIGVLIFGSLASLIDNFIRPIFISRMTKLHSSIILIGMIGGLFIFGILGFLLGPLILAYLLIVLEIYRKKRIPGLLQEPENK